MSEFYVAQENAMAPGIAGEWPRVIPKPDNPNGRLLKIEGAQDAINGLKRGCKLYDEWRDNGKSQKDAGALADDLAALIQQALTILDC